MYEVEVPPASFDAHGEATVVTGSNFQIRLVVSLFDPTYRGSQVFREAADGKLKLQAGRRIEWLHGGRMNRLGAKSKSKMGGASLRVVATAPLLGIWTRVSLRIIHAITGRPIHPTF
jgi:hypothetical protein